MSVACYIYITCDARFCDKRVQIFLKEGALVSTINMGVIKNEHEQREYHEWINLAFVIFELFVFVIKSN